MAEVAFFVAGMVAEKVIDLLVDAIVKPIPYLFKYKSNIKKLTKKVEDVKDVRDTVQHDVDEAKRQGDDIEEVVEKWLNSVDEFTNGVAKPIIDDVFKAEKLCSIGFCPNLRICYSLSKKAAKATKAGVDLLASKERTCKNVSRKPHHKKSDYLCSGDYEAFGSRKTVFDDLMQTLRDADVNLIGVWGMGGVGKSTLVKKVADQAIQDKLFDEVVLVELKEQPGIENIQAQIAEQLGLIPFQEVTVSGRADRLRYRLKKENTVLIVLDNVWEKLDLESIGIPLRGDEKVSIMQTVDQEDKYDNKRQCKILLTSRKLNILRNDMDIPERLNFKVEILSEAEAEDLFWKTLGLPEKKSDLNPIAVEIVRKCDGLPIAIKTIAKALKYKKPPAWKDALDQLKRGNPKDITGVDKEGYNTIKLSFEYLDDKDAKSLLLLCSLCNAGGGINIDDLLKYSTGLGLFQGVDTLEKGRNKLDVLIDHLKNSCLLMDHDNNHFVKMHDVIQDVAVEISSTTKLWFNLQDSAGHCLKEMIKEKKDPVALSLPYRDISELPERMEFPNLELFLLYKEDASLQIPDAFFEGMDSLKVLDMSGIHLLSPPSSLGCLTNLHTLCLNHCRLEDVAIIGKLKELEVLSFLKSEIEQLPIEIGQLTRLRLLDLSNCSKLKVIKSNVISSLTRLEELYMGDSFDQWEGEGRNNASLAELKELSRLKTLDIHVPNAHIIPQDLSLKRLDRYRIFIGDVWDWSGKYETLKTLKLKLSSSIYLSNEIRSLLNIAEDVYLDELKGVKNVLYELHEEGFPQLKHLHVQNGPEIQYIINSGGFGPSTFFPKLESLFLHNLINLEKICHDQLATESFCKLRIMKVGKCDRLKHLFSFSMAKNLLKLEEIEVTDCKTLEEIIFEESEEQVHTSGIEFSQLHTLRLQCLPQLKSFGFINAFTPNTQSPEIVAADELASFSQNVSLPSLKMLKLSSINIECMWLDQLPTMFSCCQTLTSLTLEECSGNLKFLFSYSVVPNLALLEKLEIQNCKSIEGIIYIEESRGEGEGIKMVFPKLIELQLKGLPNLTKFSSENSAEFPSLTRLSIQDCPKLKTFSSAIMVEEIICLDDIPPLFDQKVVLPTLASLNISSIPIQTIWHNQLQPVSSCFQNLTEIFIHGCETLKYVFSSSMVESFIKLEVLTISDCNFMEVAIISHGERISDTLFPKLYQLKLKNLPELTSFYNFEGKPIELPSLDQLRIENCPKMHTFVSNSPHEDIPVPKEVQLHSEENLHSHIKPLFDEKVRIPNLKFMRISKMDNMRRIWHHQLIPGSFSKIETFKLYDCHNLLNVFPSNMLTKLHKLEALLVRRCYSLEKIFEEPAEDARSVFSQLTRLELTDLPSLRSFYPGLCEWPKLKLLVEFSQLHTLRLQCLPQLKSFGFINAFTPNTQSPEIVAADELASFSQNVSLPSLKMLKLSSINIECMWLDQLPTMFSCCQTLTSLTLEECSGNLKFLFSYSVVPNLALLEKLEIQNCKSIEGIIYIEESRGEGGGIKMVFPKLIELQLKGLPNLTKFSSENSAEFPSLTRLSIQDCPKLKTFSSAVMVEEIICPDDIPPLFDQKVVLPTLASLNISSIPIQTIWHNQLQLVSSCFQNLTEIFIHGCETLKYVFSSSMVESFIKLEVLTISDCNFMEVAIFSHGERISVTLFPKLYQLRLINLPELTSFYNFEGKPIELPSLDQLLIENCPKMHTFVSNPPHEDIPVPKEEQLHSEENLHSHIKPLFDEEVRIPNLKFMRISKMDNMRRIWHHQLIPGSFSKIKTFELYDCHNLLNVFPSNMLTKLHKLEALCVSRCDSLEKILEDPAEDARSVFSQLTQLELTYLPSLRSVYPGLCEWPKLKLLRMWGCNKVKILTSEVSIIGKSQLENSIQDPLFIDKNCQSSKEN